MKKISDIKLKIKVNLQKINIYFYIISALITLITLFFVSVFLYNNFYQTITQSESIISLQEKVAQETIDMVNFNKIIENIAKKTEVRELKNTKNPFMGKGIELNIEE